MNKRNTLKILLDVGMTIILVLLCNSHVFSLAFHEIAGLTMAGMFVIHCLLNRNWIKSVSPRFFSKSLPRRVRFGYIINFLLLVAFILVVISGIRTSQVLFPAMAAPKGTLWRTVHHFSGAISIILTGIHIGLHWSFLKGVFQKIIRLPHKLSKPLSIVLLIIILGFGVYSIATSSFIGWLSEPFASGPSHNGEQLRSEEYWNELNNENKNENTNGNNGHTTKENENKESGQGVSNDAIPSNNEKKTDEGSVETIAITIATYLAIIGVFAAITYYIDKALIRKKANAIPNAET